AADQLPVLMAEEHRGDPATSSLKYERDVYFDKPGTDIIVNGSAYAPGGRPAKEVLVGLRVGGLDKVLKVKGDRVYEKGASGVRPTPVSAFVQVPLEYERAYGGTDTQDPDPAKHVAFFPNPLGVGHARRPEHLVGKAAPNVEFPDKPMRADRAAGLGALGNHWLPRRLYAGTYDDEWQANRRPLLPHDYDHRWNMCAPIDQQIEPHWSGTGTVRLTNLTAKGHLELVLPPVRLKYLTEFYPVANREPMELRPKLHTVVLEPDEGRVIAVWHGRFVCGRSLENIEHTLVVEEPRG
ncbi:MAG: DUF2169 domain-containing protein, partial [Archangium sp.]|nr:DUF2169 domain-containing protein [Archangium sp.]